VRDFLREHSDEATEYGELKMAIAREFPFDNDGYCDAKHQFVQDLEQRALR
jgi:GrpB-like predicted nucleotidyltransferase (UPF0157 family)